MIKQSRRTRSRAFLALVVVLAVAPACDASGRDGSDSVTAIARSPVPPPPSPGVSSSMGDTVPLESLVMWDAAGAQTALATAGLPPRIIRSELAYAGLPNGFALGVASAEVHIFILGDIAAADAAYRRLDVRNVRPIEPSRSVPSAFINNNMLVVVFADDASLRQRIERALPPGTADGTGRHVEP